MGNWSGVPWQPWATASSPCGFGEPGCLKMETRGRHGGHHGIEMLPKYMERVSALVLTCKKARSVP